MKLEKIKIHNLFQYTDLEVSFSGNLVGIVGKNGTGKSNFLNSLHFAFAGEVPGKTKEQVLHWGADEGYAIVEFNHAGRSGRIERHTPGTKASFKYGDEKAVTGIRQVNEAVLNMLGMDKDVFRLVFVKQAELDAILFDQASRREVAFQRMCGLGEANRLHKNLSDLVQQVFNESAGDIEATIATLKSEKENSEKELKELRSKYQDLQNDLTRNGSLVELTLEQNRWTTASRLKFALRLAEQTGKANEAEYEKLSAQLVTLGSNVTEDIVRKAKETLQTEELSLRDLETTEKAYAECKSRVEMNQLTVDSVKAESEEYNNLHALESEVDAESKELAKGRALAALYKAAIDACSMNEFPVCPLCGQSFPHNLTQMFVEKMESCHVDDGHYRRLLDKLEVQRKRAAELAGKLSTLTEMISRDNEWLESHPSIGEQALQSKRAMVSDMKEFVTNMANKYSEAKQLEWRIQQLASDIGTRKANYTDNKIQLEKLGIPERMTYEETEEELKKAGANLEYSNKVHSELNSVAAVMTSLERRIYGIKQSLEDAARKLANSEIREKAYRTLNKVADWLHYSNGPHKLAQRIMLDLTNDTNKFLETLGSPFSVSIDPETLGYLFSMNDGSGPESPMPADTLSGGQKVLLAISFRLASYCMFAGKYGLLSLDEPTAYLDDANVANFCTLLESVKAMATSMDLQILISTHERMVLPYMDSVLDIDKEKE